MDELNQPLGCYKIMLTQNPFPFFPTETTSVQFHSRTTEFMPVKQIKIMIKGQNQTNLFTQRKRKALRLQWLSSPRSPIKRAGNLICLPTRVKFTPTWQSVNVSAFHPRSLVIALHLARSLLAPYSNFKISMKAFISLEFDVLFRFSLLMSVKMYDNSKNTYFSRLQNAFRRFFVFFQRDNCLLIALHFKTPFLLSSTQKKLLVTSSRLMTWQKHVY